MTWPKPIRTTIKDHTIYGRHDAEFLNFMRHISNYPNDEATVECMVRDCVLELRGGALGSKNTTYKAIEYIDDRAFHKNISKCLRLYDIRLKVINKNIDAKVAGRSRLVTERSLIEFQINSALMRKLFASGGRCSQGPYITGGRMCSTSLECFVLTVMHEMCHVATYIGRMAASSTYRSKKPPSHGPLFQLFAMNVFRQPESRNMLNCSFKARNSMVGTRSRLMDKKYAEIFTTGGWIKCKVIKLLDTTAIVRIYQDVPKLHNKNTMWSDAVTVSISLLRD